MSFTTVTVTETIEPDQPGGETPAGYVTFELSERIADGEGNEVEPAILTATVTEEGTISIELWANNDPTTTPEGSFYTVGWVITGSGFVPPKTIVVPCNAEGGTCTLSSL